MLPALPGTECCGTDPTDTQNDSPSHVRRASHNLSSDQRYRRRRRLPHPSPLKYGYWNLSSDRHAQGSMQPQGMPVRFLQYMRSFHPHLPASSAVRTPHNCRLYNKFPCCFFRIFHARCCDILTAPLSRFSFLPLWMRQKFSAPAPLLLQFPRLLQALRSQVRSVSYLTYENHLSNCRMRHHPLLCFLFLSYPIL